MTITLFKQSNPNIKKMKKCNTNSFLYNYNNEPKTYYSLIQDCLPHVG